jgi:hypothetical protein
MSHVGAAKVKEVQQDLEIALNKTETEESGVRPDETAANTLVNAQESESTLLRHSVLRDVIIGTSGSSKLNYILEEVRTTGFLFHPLLRSALSRSKNTQRKRNS